MTPKFKLTIHTSPSNAKVYVTNIKPKYKDGMLLSKGTYRVKVVADGYETQTLKVVLSKDIIKDIQLRKNINKVACDSRFSSSCTECFLDTRIITLDQGIVNLNLSINGGEKGKYIYPDENKKPLNIHALFTNGEIETKTPSLKWSSENLYKDKKGEKFLKISSNESKKVLYSTEGFIKLAKPIKGIAQATQYIPIWELKYTINYYDIGRRQQQTMETCILSYTK